MTNAILGQEASQLHHLHPGPLTELTQVFYDLGKYTHAPLLYNPEALAQRITTLVTECIDSIQVSHKDITPETRALHTSRCHIVAKLAAMVKLSPQLKYYPEVVYHAITERIEFLCLTFHRLLYRFFAADYQLPESYVKMEVSNARMQYQRLLQQYPGNKLLRAILRAVHTFVHHSVPEQRSKERVDYINTLLHNLKLWNRAKGAHEQLFEIAIAMNLNCRRLLHYMATEAGMQIHAAQSGANKLACIGRLRKQYLQALTTTRWQPATCGGYSQETDAVAIHIEEWLNRQANLTSEEIKADREELDRAEMRENGIFFSVFVRMLVVAGFTKLRKFAPVLRILSKVVSFPRAEMPSAENLVTMASNRVSATTIRKLEALLDECGLILRKIKRNGGRFPDDLHTEE